MTTPFKDLPLATIYTKSLNEIMRDINGALEAGDSTRWFELVSGMAIFTSLEKLAIDTIRLDTGPSGKQHEACFNDIISTTLLKALDFDACEIEALGEAGKPTAYDEHQHRLAVNILSTMTWSSE